MNEWQADKGKSIDEIQYSTGKGAVIRGDTLNQKEVGNRENERSLQPKQE